MPGASAKLVSDRKPAACPAFLEDLRSSALAVRRDGTDTS
jgi:hypothetical protein